MCEHGSWLVSMQQSNRSNKIKGMLSFKHTVHAWTRITSLKYYGSHMYNVYSGATCIKKQPTTILAFYFRDPVPLFLVKG